MKPRGTPPTEGLVGIAMHVLFCLFFLLGGLGFLCFGLCSAACLPPILEARPAGLWTRGGVNLGYDPLNGMRYVGDGDSEAVDAGRHIPDPLLRDDLVRRVSALDIKLPLLNGELAGDVVDDLAFFSSSGRAGLQEANERSQQSADNNSTGGDQSYKDGIGHRLDRESLLLGMLWALAFGGGMLIGAFVTSLILRQNVKGVARRKVDCQSEAKEGRCPPLPLPSCSESSSLVDGITSDGCSTSADTPESTPLPELPGWPLAQLPEHEHEWPQPVPPHPIVHVSRNEIENCPLCQCIAAPTDPADSSQ